MSQAEVAPPNPRVQRTRSSPSARHSPLTRHPLGGQISRAASVPFLFVTLALIGCDGGVYARGIVQTPDATPISAANVVLASPKGWAFYAKTDAGGCFKLGGLTAPGRYRYSLVATAQGYESIASDVRTLRKSFVVVTLVPEKAGTKSTAEVIEVEPQSSEIQGKPCSQP